MRLDLFVKLKNYLLILNILCVTYFLTLITMHDSQTIAIWVTYGK